MSVEHSHPLLSDTGWVATGFTPQTGWSGTTEYRRIGDIVHLRLAMTYSGATLTGSATGNVTDTAIVQIPTLAQPHTAFYTHCDVDQVTFGSVFVSSAGMVTLTGLHTGGTIASGGGIHITTTYFAA